MQGLWLEDGRSRLRDDLPVPDPPPGEARVRVLRAGICNTDLELIRGYYPYRGVLGHEFVGMVEEIRAPRDRGGTVDARELAGRRVVGEINASCGECRRCREGRARHCADRTVLGIVDRDGAFAEQLILPVENLHPVPEGVSTDAATFTEPLAAALEITEQVQIRPEHRVLVVGDGKLGQLVARVLALSGCELTVVGRHPRKLSLVAEEGTRTVRAPRPGDGSGDEGDRGSASDGGNRDPSGDGASLPDGLTAGTFDVAVDCTGNASGFRTALRALRPRGTLVMKSTYAGELALDASALVVDEITLVGSRCGPFPPALRLLATGRIDPGPLVDARFPLGEAEAALERARERDTLKVLLET